MQHDRSVTLAQSAVDAPTGARVPGSAAERGRRLFEFLAAAQRLKSTPVRSSDSYDHMLWLGDLPDHPAVLSAHTSTNPDPAEPLLVVSRVPAVAAPAVPRRLAPWLDGPADRADQPPALRETIMDPASTDADGAISVVHRADQPGLTDVHARWHEQWAAWAERELQDRPVRELYKTLFAMQVTVTGHTEELELVLGVGALAWAPDGHPPVRRHVLVGAATLALDDDSGDLTVAAEPAVETLSLELDMLDPSRLPATGTVNDVRASVHDFTGHPLSRIEAGRLVRRIVNSLSSEGRYVDEDVAPRSSPEPEAAFAPALIVRKRSSKGLIAVFDHIAQDIADSGNVPAGLASLIEPDYVPPTEADPSPGAVVAVDGDDDLFMPLPLNDVQQAIVHRVDRHAQTLVQGPPGTGKTHTAAALLAHLLAQGKRVLVTAQTDRALHEVRSKLPDAIKPLAVAVVGTDRSDMADLKVAVERLSNASSDHDPKGAARSIDERLASIDTIRRRRAEIRHRLVAARATEVGQHTYAGYQGTLARIAQDHQFRAASFQWIADYADPLPDAAPPVETDQAVRWLHLLRDRTLLADEEESQQRLLDLAAVPDPDAFAAMVDAEASGLSAEALHRELTASHAAFTAVVALPEPARADLQRRMRRLAREAHGIARDAGSWIDGALRDIRGRRGATWKARAADLHALVTDARPFVGHLGRATEVRVDPAADLGGLRALAQGLHAHLVVGGEVKTAPDGTPKVGAFTPRPVKAARPLFDAVRVDGGPPVTMERITAFMAHVDGERYLTALDRAWPASVVIPAEDTLRERLQWHVTELEQLDRLLVLGEELTREEEHLTRSGLPHPDWNDVASVLAYADLVDAAAAHEASLAAREPLQELEAVAAAVTTWADAAATSHRLHLAVRRRDRDAYAAAHARTGRLHAVRDLAAERDRLTRQVALGTKALADAVAADPFDQVWDERVPQLAAAWDWARTGAWILAQATDDTNDLQRQISALEDQLRRDVEALAATRAWSHAVSPTRLTGRSKADLTQYAQLVRRLGKGSGKYAAAQRAEIREAMDRCRPAVPVWILPIYRIAEQLRVSRDMFDVVIVDEASQAGLEAAFLQYLAPKIVVIGDDKQVSPTAVGVDQQQLRDLAEQYLYDDRYQASWQDPKRSLFDEANMRYGSKLTLVEHRRCVPEIIGFSNRIAYEPENIRLLPVRQYGSDRLEPIRAVHVTDGYERGTTGSKTNPAEVDAVVDQVLKCLADPRYDGLTFGVISLQGGLQARRIESALLEVVPAEEWSARDLRCGDAADFQGSERDVVFLSMVSAVEDGRRLGAMTSEMYVQRFNVAASRAKDQLWLFHSLTLSDLPNSADMRHHLLDYCYGVINRAGAQGAAGPGSVPDDVRVEPFDSLFEQRVYNRIVDRGYHVVPQFPSNGYSLDLVVIGATGRLAIECDGDAWHGPEVFERDLARQRDLERCGWQFFRIRESAWYVDQHAVLEELWTLLESRGIKPSDTSPEAAPPEEGPSRTGGDASPPVEVRAAETAGAVGLDDVAVVGSPVPVTPVELAQSQVLPPRPAEPEDRVARPVAARPVVARGVRAAPAAVDPAPPRARRGKVLLSESARGRVAGELELIAGWLAMPFTAASADGRSYQLQAEDHDRRRDELLQRQVYLWKVITESEAVPDRGAAEWVSPGSTFELQVHGRAPMVCRIASIGEDDGVVRISPETNLGRAVEGATSGATFTYEAPQRTLSATVVRVLD